MSSEAAQPLDLVAQALSDPTRRRILRMVRDDERAAGELAHEFTHLSRPAVSQHLRVLQDAKLVTVRRDGNRRMYRSRPEGLEAVRHFIDEMWSDRLTRLRHAAERAERPGPRPAPTEENHR